MRRELLLAGAVLLAAGCNMAPPLQTPPAALPETYPAVAAPLEGATPAYTLGWEQFVLDPQLRQLIAIALDDNQDLAAATARIEQAEALYRIQNSLRVPALNAGLSSQRSGGPSPAGGRAVAESHSVQVAVPAFELDFWGRVANLSEAARRQYLATVEARQAFQLSVVGSVATAYYILRSSEDGVALAQRTLDSRRQTLELARLRMEGGLTSSIDHDQAHALVNQAQVQLTQFEQTRQQALGWLRALTGVDPEAIVEPAGMRPGEAGQLAAFSPGLPSQLLANRPDIRLAEHRLAAANANIGAARAAYFPTITLSGATGYASAELSDLFSGGSNVWSIGAGALLPIFDMGRRKAQVRFSEAELAEREAEYRQAVLNAFRETHDGLYALQANAERLASLARSVQVQQNLAETAQARYEVGLSPYLEVLDAERGLFSAQQALLQAQGTDLQDRVNLYLSLGGGDLGLPAR
jgi:multidrug efflux system outer membrane protein